MITHKEWNFDDNLKLQLQGTSIWKTTWNYSCKGPLYGRRPETTAARDLYMEEQRMIKFSTVSNPAT